MLTVQTARFLIGSVICVAIFGGYFMAIVMIAGAIQAITEK